MLSSFISQRHATERNKERAGGGCYVYRISWSFSPTWLSIKYMDMTWESKVADGLRTQEYSQEHLCTRPSTARYSVEPNKCL